VFAINPPLCYLPDQGIGPWQRRLWALTAYPISKRPVIAALHRLPESVWTVLDRLGLFPSPARYLRRAAARGTRVQLVFSANDPSLVDLQVRADRAVRRVIEQGQASMLIVDGMDHSMFDQARRADVLDALRKACGGQSTYGVSAQSVAAQA